MNKTGLHPEIFNVDAHCVCGTHFQTTSILSKISVDICSNCHPFFSGVHKFVDSAGRIERFNSRYSNVAPVKKPVSRVNDQKGAKRK